jgi:glycosyltransferase involved in cell wall biosynthesis
MCFDSRRDEGRERIPTTMDGEAIHARLRVGPGRRFDARELSRLLSWPVPQETRQPNVLMAGGLTALAAPGGGQIQMTCLTQALAARGVAARPWRPWEDTFEGVDILHLFGTLREYLPVVKQARRRGVRVALSPIAWYDWQSLLREPRSWPRRLAACAKFRLRAALPQLPSWRRDLYHACDLLMPNSRAEADQLARYFDVEPERLRVVVNGADERFANGDPRMFARRAGGYHFVLYPARIEPRKNQLGFLRAMREVNVPIVILGDPVPGHEAYFAACHRAAGPNVRFLPRIDHGDPLLASAYAACGCMVLASWFETPGLVALEAGMSGVPLVLTRGGCTQEYFGELAQYVAPGDASSIRSAVLTALDRGRNPELARHVREHFSWTAAARATREAYEELA